MATNKVIYGSTVLIDLTADTVTADKILTKYTAHDASGAAITGTCTYDVDSKDATVAVAEMLTGKTAYLLINTIFIITKAAVVFMELFKECACGINVFQVQKLILCLQRKCLRVYL